MRPLKLRLVVEAQTSPSARTPVLIPRQAPQVGLVTQKPASMKVPMTPSSSACWKIAGVAGERGIRLRRGTGLHLYNSEVSGSDRCLDVSGESLNLLDTRITFDGVGLGCVTVVEGGVQAIQDFLDGSTNVTQDGSQPNPVTLPAGFDGAGDTIIGSDVANWGSGWTVGIE